MALGAMGDPSGCRLLGAVWGTSGVYWGWQVVQVLRA